MSQSPERHPGAVSDCHDDGGANDSAVDAGSGAGSVGERGGEARHAGGGQPHWTSCVTFTLRKRGRAEGESDGDGEGDGSDKRQNALELYDPQDPVEAERRQAEEMRMHTQPGVPIMLVDSETQATMLESKGNSLALQGQFSAAISVWSRAVEFTQGGRREAMLHEQCAQALLELDQPFRAILAAEKAVACDSEWGEAFRTLGRAQLNFGDAASATESLELGVGLGVDVRAQAAALAETELASARGLAEEQCRRAEDASSRDAALLAAARSQERLAAWKTQAAGEL